MKKISYFFLPAVVALFMLISNGCQKSSNDTTTVGGTPTPMGNVGNTFSGGIAGATNLNGVITVSKDNISTIHCTGTITDPALKTVLGLLNSSSLVNVNPTTGAFTADLKVMFLSTGIVDYFSSDNTGSALIGYGAAVGTKYTCKNAEGHTFTREVTAVSTADDYFYGGLMIKTTTIKELSPARGIDRIEYRTNHKFGLVGIYIYLDDSTSYFLPVYSTNTNE